MPAVKAPTAEPEEDEDLPLKPTFKTQKTLSPRTLIHIGAGIDDDDIRDVHLRDVGRA